MTDRHATPPAEPLPDPAAMGERRGHSFHMKCHMQKDYGSRLSRSLKARWPNGYASTSLSANHGSGEEAERAASGTATTAGITATTAAAKTAAAPSSSLAPAAAASLGAGAERSRYAPVSLEMDPCEVNNGSGIPSRPPPYTKDPALQITPVSGPPPPPPLPRSSWMHHHHHHHKSFQSPYAKTSMQGDVYNFLERPAGLKCFLYHFLV